MVILNLIKNSNVEEYWDIPKFLMDLMLVKKFKNDDFTTKDFVELILVKIFHKTQDEAVKITENVHKKGKGVVGIYPFDIAVTRIEIVHSNARANGFPLRCTMEQV